MLTDDADNRRKASADGILTSSVGDYVKSLTETPHLQDKLCIKDYTSEANSRPIFPPHLTVVQIHDGIKNGRFHQGSFIASRENFLEGSVNVEGYEKPVSSEIISIYSKVKLFPLDPHSRTRAFKSSNWRWCCLHWASTRARMVMSQWDSSGR